jgi:hypothetical protein
MCTAGAPLPVGWLGCDELVAAGFAECLADSVVWQWRVTDYGDLGGAVGDEIDGNLAAESFQFGGDRLDAVAATHAGY